MKCILTIASLLFLAACSKHSGDVAPTETPSATLTVLAPTTGATYRNGDTVWIKATAIAPANIHGYEVSINPAGDSTKLFSAHVHDHNDTLQINQYWVNDRTGVSNLEARILLTLDHEGHTLERVVPIGTR
ncbi:hypothetical protein [Flaviaesturariibacter aridisoli]|uniref:DUF4625 domain-containing protein n=1 Tax=Flaviaesturariibacter aridisoli TaxID=2545761 RepID=A0A4R4DTU8_9BACT|nr:hypothetical protein [Flaviaesturariibacter aridisoli]TCZ66522.1 hypothetical protein E0486_16535 [Flaviaesturariibacter aridisoli]